MLKPRNILFSSIMSAGYISADTYRAVLHKKYFHELSFQDCFSYAPDTCAELKQLFENDSIIEKLYCLEHIEEKITSDDSAFFNLISNYISGLNPELYILVELLGIKPFLSKYLLCTNEVLCSLYLIDEANSRIIDECREDIVNKLKEEFNTIQPSVIFSSEFEIEPVSSIVSEPHGVYGIKSGKGFDSNDIFVIDGDAIAPENTDMKKYVLFLYSLDRNDFEPIKSYYKTVSARSSVRMINGINSIGIRNFFVNYLFAEESKLYQIRNFGKKSIFDVAKIRKVLIDFVVDLYKQDTEGTTKEIEEIIESGEQTLSLDDVPLKERIGEAQYAVLYAELRHLIKSTSVRAQNGINNYHGDFIEDFVYHRNDIKKIKNIGKKTELEIIQIVENLSATLNDMKQRALTPEELFWLEKKNLFGSLLDDFTVDFYNKHDRIPILHVLDNCMRTLLKDRKYYLLNEVCPLFESGEGRSLAVVAEESDLTRERVRQICTKSIQCLNLETDDDALEIYKNLLETEEYWAYYRDSLFEKQLWNASDFDSLTVQEECHLTQSVLLIVFAYVFKDSFLLLGKSPFSVSSRQSSWNGTYLVDRTLMECFDFEKMMSILEEVESTSSQSITLSTQELLLDTFYGAWLNFDFMMVEKIAPIVNELLIVEKGFIPDYEYKFTIEGRKTEAPEDVLYNILKLEGNPIDLDRLFVLYEQEYPDKYKSPNSLRAIINRDPRICFLGVENKIALMEWEHIHIGSIRDLIVSYLEKFSEPQHLKNIVEYILQKRKTTENSIRSTMSSGDQFQQFNGGFYGLSDKTYDDWFYLSESEKTSRKKLIEFEDFIKENNHFPFFPSAEKNEELLYQWWNRVNRQKDKSDFLEQEISRIKIQYSSLPKRKKDFTWYSMCKQVDDFISIHGRKPDTRIIAEQELARWFNNTFNDIAEGRLSSEQESAFINLCKKL